MNNKDILNDLIKLLSEYLKTLPQTAIELYKAFVKKLRFSIGFKITTSFTLSMISFIFFIWLVSLSGFSYYLVYNSKLDMLKDKALINSYLKGNIDSTYETIDKLSQVKERQISIFDEKGTPLFSSEKSKENVVYFEGIKEKYILISEDNLSFHNISINNAARFIMILEHKLQVDGNSYTLQIVDHLNKEFYYVSILIIALSVVTILAILKALATGKKASKTVLEPLDEMTKTVKNITINALDTRLNLSGSQDELKDLAHTFNSMLDRIQQSYDQQNRFVSDASHELRTPIAVIQGYANLLDRWGKNDKEVLEESIEAIKSESENMKALIEQLLFLARGDKNTQTIKKANFYLNDLIDELIKETKLIDDKHNISCCENQAVEINADRGLIKEALRIFVDNSTKYTPEGGLIKINSIASETDVIISIEDSGVGISKEDLPHIFDRFYRADKSRTKQGGGTGLGLAIAKWIIMKHKGNITVESNVGAGTKIIITLSKI